MVIQKKEVGGIGIKFYVNEMGQEVARAYLYVLTNDLHKEPFGFMEDVFVEEPFRTNGYGNILVDAVIEEAKSRGCYKLICTSRHSKPEVHSWYERKGFENHGLEFRIDF
ncbi:MAG: GNAT family N-acetyltransferase [Nanoarchaeota archaeon]|nr:GNAT family N-acetyltransferase [Nanoarchaeota archaeon]